MPLFTYKVKDKKGKIIEDVLQAVDKKDAVSTLKSEEYQILTLKNVEQGFSSSFSFGGISVSEKATFSRFMGTMIRAGLPLPEAIDIIKEETKSERLKKIIYDISFQIRKGKTLSSTLSKYKKDFDPVFLTMIKAGEESGTLDKSFDYLAKQLLSTYELTQKVKGALMYPAVIVAAMGANFAVMLVFVLPKMSEVFTQLNVELPLTTRLVVNFGNFVGDNMFLVIGSTLFLIFLVVVIFVVESTRKVIIDFFMKIPIVKNVSIQLDIARFTQTLSTLLKSGVPIVVSLDVATDIIRHPLLKKRAEELSKGVSEGRSLSEILVVGKQVFPTTVVQTIKAGEKSGNLEEVLEEMADFYAKEVDYSMKRLTALLEPMLILVIGIAVGAMVVIMITPIYKMVGGIEGQY